MNEKRITQKVIKLAKAIAELWRMEPYEGCWIKTEDGLFLFNPEKMFLDGVALRFSNGKFYKKWFPIPDIVDCLDKLRERDEWMPDYYNKKDFNRSLLNIFKNYIEGKFTVTEVHYWLLSALLEVLKNE